VPGEEEEEGEEGEDEDNKNWGRDRGGRREVRDSVEL
jgi:hypothetical protein